MSSREILAQIKFYEGIKATVSGLYIYFNRCIDVSLEALRYNAYELVINGKPLIEGDVTMKDINSQLNDDIAILDAIVDECNKIIDELWVAYYAALEQEKANNKE